MIPVAAVDTFLHAQGLDVKVLVLGPDQIDIPGLSDRAVFVYPTPGAGLELERTFDRPSCQLRIRGAQRDYHDAETLASQVDLLMIGGQPKPVTIDGRRCLDIARVGGGPGYLLRDTSGRSHFTGNYIFSLPLV